MTGTFHVELSFVPIPLIQNNYSLRCLEAIVSGAFPDEATSTISDLLTLGRCKGYHMPDVSTVSSTQDDMSIDDSTLYPPLHIENSSPVNLHLERNDGSEVHREGSKHHHETPRLIQDTAGRSHYIGPSGSLSFFAELRKLVSERQPTSRFASDNVAEALEARPEPLDDSHLANLNAVSSPATVLSVVESLRSTSCLRKVPPHILDKLVHLFFDHVHADFPLFHRAIFLDEFESYTLSRDEPRMGAHIRYPAEGGRTDPDDGWLVCLHMMIAFGCLVQRTLNANDNSAAARFDYKGLQSECWITSRSALPRLTTMCVQSHVQSLLLIALYLHSINERNASWILAGCASRIGVAIGLHRNELHASFSLIERETRKRLWSTLYSFEQFLCLSLGRPSGVDDDEVKATAPSDDIMGSSNGAPGCSESNFQLQLLSSKLRKIMSVQHQTTRASAPSTRPTPRSMLNELTFWEHGLPAHLVLPETLLENHVPSESQILQYCSQYTTHHLRSIILLHIQFHNLVILATRPYLLMLISGSSKNPNAVPYPWDDTSTTGRTPSNEIDEMARGCVASASRVATLILILDRLHIMSGLTWLDVYYAYSAAMILLLRLLWISSSIAKPDEREKEESIKARAKNLVIEIRHALKRINKSPTMHRFAAVVDNFADAITLSLSSNQSQRWPMVNRETSGTQNEAEMSSFLTSHLRSGSHQHQMSDSQYDEGSVMQSTNTVMQIPSLSVPAYGVADSLTNSHGTYDREAESAPCSTENVYAGGHSFEPDEALTEAARVISSFSAEALSAGSLLWNDSLQSVTQHIIDWNDFEHFLGSLGEG